MEIERQRALGAIAGPLKALTRRVREVAEREDDILGTASNASKMPAGGDGPW